MASRGSRSPSRWFTARMAASEDRQSLASSHSDVSPDAALRITEGRSAASCSGSRLAEARLRRAWRAKQAVSSRKAQRTCPPETATLSRPSARAARAAQSADGARATDSNASPWAATA